jgi:hypothetical protein
MTEKKQPEEKRILLGYAAVDSGQLLVTDPCYLKDWQANEYDDEKPDSEGLHSYSYQGACNATCGGLGDTKPRYGGALRFAKGHEGAGVAFSTGFGDGSYPVYGYLRDCGEWGVRVARVEIDFMGEEEDEEG